MCIHTFKFPNQKFCIHFSSAPSMSHSPPIWFDNRNDIWRGMQIEKLLICVSFYLLLFLLSHPPETQVSALAPCSGMHSASVLPFTWCTRFHLRIKQQPRLYLCISECLYFYIAKGKKKEFGTDGSWHSGMWSALNFFTHAVLIH
jgi:hypothetical protein